MAALPLGASWSPPTTVGAAACRSMRPICRALYIHPLCSRGLSSTLFKMEAGKLDAFRTHCQKRIDHLPEPEPEREDNDLYSAEIFDMIEKRGRSMLGVRVAPDMFVQEKDRISKYKMKIRSSNDLGNVERAVAQIVCEYAWKALNVASEVMDITDITDLGIGRTEISQHTANQMVRTYASIFCNVAEDAYRLKIEMETIFSYLGGLRGLGAICCIMIQDIVTKLKDGPLKNSITSHMDRQFQEFDKKMNNLEDETAKMDRQFQEDENAKMKAQVAATRMLFDGLEYVRSYIVRLVECRQTALNYLQ